MKKMKIIFFSAKGLRIQSHSYLGSVWRSIVLICPGAFTDVEQVFSSLLQNDQDGFAKPLWQG